MVRKRTKNVLFLKSVRDIKKSLPQFTSILLMAMITVTIITGLDSLWISIKVHTDSLYSAANTASLWVTVINPSEKDIWKIKQIEGISAVEKRFKLNVDTDLPDTPTLTVYAAPGSNVLDRPFITSGMAAGKTGAVLDQRFAAAHHLSPGDKIRIKVNGRWIKYTIAATAINSEQVYSIKDSSSSMPEPVKYGFIMVNIDTVKQAFNGHAYYNQIELALADGADSAKIQNQLDAVLQKKLIGIQAHDDVMSFSVVQNQIQQFQTIARVFPVIFFIITALITLSTMIRLVEEQRNQIGVMKALGYGKRTIIWHYTSYGIYVGIAGVIIGCILGPSVITRTLFDSLRNRFYLPSYRILLYWQNITLAGLLIIFCTGGISAYSCVQLLDQLPSELLRARPPKKGYRIFLEKINFIWNNMKFSHKLIARNLIRNKMRFVMSALGIMGCTALILAAFTQRTAMLSIATSTYGEIYTYDTKFLLDGASNDRFYQNLELNARKQTLFQGAIYACAENGTRKMIPVTVTSADSPMMNLPDQDGSGKLSLGHEGIIMTRKQAQTMGVKKGDTIYLKRTDDTYLPVKIDAITRIKTGQGIYMSNTFYESLGETYRPTSLLVKWNGEPGPAAGQFIHSDRVVSQISMDKQISDINDNLSIITIVVSMLIAFGAALAFIVIYNMGMLNFFERIRDLSTLSVLGFYHQEIRALVLADNLFSAVLGIIFGIPFGKLLASTIIMGMGTDMDLSADLRPGNIIISAVLTVVFAVIVNLVLSKKMKKINMLDALKSVE